MASTAEKLDLELWEEAKADARAAYGGHSARAMQYASKLYKARGGRYRGRKRADNRLVQWTRQDWTTKSGRPSRETGERYLPRSAIESLSPQEYGATTRAKRRGGGVGSVVAQPPSIREKTRKFRKVNPMASPAQIAARKKFAERARSGELAQLRKKATKRNPAKTVSEEISRQVRKGKPQKQAVAIALEMERAGKVKKNPTTISMRTTPIKWTPYKIPGSGTVYEGFYNGYVGTVFKKDNVWTLLVMKDNPTRTALGQWDSIDGTAKGAKGWLEIVVDNEAWKGIKRNLTATRAPARSRTKLVSSGREKNPVKRQKMGKIAWLSRGGEREIMEVPIDFSFKQYVGNIQENFFARTENGFLIVTEKSTGFKVGQVPHTMRAAALNDRAAAKRFVESILERIGADKFRQAIKSQPKIA